MDALCEWMCYVNGCVMCRDVLGAGREKEKKEDGMHSKREPTH